MLEKEQRKALRREAKEIRAAFGRLWGDDGETNRQREKLTARYNEIARILQEERERVLKECHGIWEEYAALRADQDEQRETLMARYKELYHILRKSKEDKANVEPGSIEDIPSPRELAEGRQPPGSEVVFDFSSFVVSEEHQATPPPSQQPTQLGTPLPTFSETGEVTHADEKAADEAPEAAKPAEDDNAFVFPSLEETGGLPVFSPDEITEAKKESTGSLDDEVWVAKEEDAAEKESISSLDALDLSELLGDGGGADSAPKSPKADAAPKAPPAQDHGAEAGNKGGFADAAWDSAPDMGFPQSFKRDSQPGKAAAEDEPPLPPLPPAGNAVPSPKPANPQDQTTDSGSWDSLPKRPTPASGAPAPSGQQKADDDDEDDVVFG